MNISKQPIETADIIMINTIFSTGIKYLAAKIIIMIAAVINVCQVHTASFSAPSRIKIKFSQWFLFIISQILFIVKLKLKTNCKLYKEHKTICWKRSILMYGASC